MQRAGLAGLLLRSHRERDYLEALLKCLDLLSPPLHRWDECTNEGGGGLRARQNVTV